jgi:signal transduction histidine kinase
LVKPSSRIGSTVKIKSKIIAFQVFFIAVVLLMAAVVYFAIIRADYYIDRVSHAHRQLETITALSLHANRYSEQIAEMLLFGEQGRAEFEEARRDLTASFATLEQVATQEIEFLHDSPEQEREQEELLLIDDMRELTARMHATALELLGVKLSGREDLARLRYFGEIEEDLDDRLQRLIDLAIMDEREEVRRVDSRTEALTRELVVVVVATTLVALVASVGAVMLLTGALARPIDRLIGGAAAIGGGHLEHRIPIEGKDELATLSGHFNHMAERLGEQHRSLLEQQGLLEAKVGERTGQLEEANRRLKDLDRLRVLFLADVSHELRTPLTVLRGEAEVTLRSRTARSEDYREALEGVVEHAESMGRLIDDLLFLTRAEADSLRFQLGRVQLQAVLAEAVEEGRILVGAAANELVAAYPSEPLEITGDRQRLKQTALIAIDNAIKYSYPKTPINVELRAENDEAVVRVRNVGAAIPSGDLPYVFERFYRGRQGKPTGGSGLGLSIAKWIVEKHGGKIAIASRPDGVTELEIRLQRA